jgi:hypothetical protein
VDGGSTAQSGICKFGKACIQHYFFIGTLAIMWTISNTNAKPLLNAIELSVEKANLTLAFGIYAACYRMIGSIPSPKIVGKQSMFLNLSYNCVSNFVRFAHLTYMHFL